MSVYETRTNIHLDLYEKFQLKMGVELVLELARIHFNADLLHGTEALNRTPVQHWGKRIDLTILSILLCSVTSICNDV